MSETGPINGHTALAQMTARCEALVRDLGLPGQIELIENETLPHRDHVGSGSGRAQPPALVQASGGTLALRTLSAWVFR